MTGTDPGSLAPEFDPAHLSTPAEFAAVLVRLRERAGKTVRALARETGIPSATLGGYFAGRHLPAVSQPEALERMLAALAVPEGAYEAWHEALRRVRRVRHRPAGEAPYRGLAPFDIDDAELFFGREDLTEDLAARVRNLRAGDIERRFLALVGVSGCGKSSLLRAGLLARLRAQDFEVGLLEPGEDPVAALGRVVDGFSTSNPVLAVDQLEEVFDGRVGEAARRDFFDRLIGLATGRETRTTVVVSIRADFYGRCLEVPRLLRLFAGNQVLVGAMDREALTRAILEPAARQGVDVEPELVEAVYRDLTGRGGDGYDAAALPHVEHALLAAWQRCDGRTLGVRDYIAAGGVSGAIRTTAEEVYATFDEAEQLIARRLFGQLVAVDDEGRAVRRRLAHTDGIGDGEGDEDRVMAVIEALVRRRILVAAGDTVEISHEALLSSWPRLADWMAEYGDALRMRHRITQAAATWEEHGRSADNLLRGPLLELAAPLLTPGRPLSLTGNVRGFVEVSVQEDRQQRHRRRRGRRRLRVLTACAIVLAIVATGLSIGLVVALGTAKDQQRAAVAARNAALSRQVAIEANDEAQRDPSLAEHLALPAYRISPTVEARSALLDATARPMVNRVVGPPGSTRAVASPDGDTEATVYADGTVHVRHLEGMGATRAVDHVVSLGKGLLFAAAYRNDGHLLAVGGANGVVRLIDTSDPDHPRLLTQKLVDPNGSKQAVEAVAFSHDGSILAAATGARRVLRWTGGSDAHATPLAPLRDLGGAAYSVAFSAGGLLAAGTDDGHLHVWRQGSSRHPRPLVDRPVGAAGDSVASVAFSPDGRLLAAGFHDKHVRVWRVGGGALGRPTKVLGGFPSWVNSVAFSPDGDALAAGGSAGRLAVWDTDSWKLTHDLAGAANFTSVDFAGDDTVLTGSVDGIQRTYPLHGPRLTSFQDTAWSLVPVPDSHLAYLGVGAAAPSVQVVDLTNPRAPRRVGNGLHAPKAAGVLSGPMGVAPDGSVVAAGTTTGHVVVWRMDSPTRGNVVADLPAATSLVESIAFSPDGRLFAVGADDGSLSVYRLHDEDGRAGRPHLLGRTNLDSNIILSVAFAASSDVVAAAAVDNKVHLVDVGEDGLTTGWTLGGFDNYAASVAFSPDGHLLAAGSADKTVRIWRLHEHGRPTLVKPVLRGPGNAVYGVAFSSDSRLLAGAGVDETMWVWRLSQDEDPTLWARLEAEDAPMVTAAFLPGTHTLLGTGQVGIFGTWLAEPERAASMLCVHSGSPLTEGEWKAYVPGAEYDPPCA